jgi:hypothetical protein
MELLYLADRHHFIEHGVPITGDRLCAMPYGPVPSASLDAINGFWSSGEQVFRYIHVNDRRAELRQSPGTAALSKSEIASVDAVVREQGPKATWQLVRETHRLPEYVESYVEGSARTIPYERIAKFSGRDERFRLDRPVVCAEAAALMPCPFPPDFRDFAGL